MKKYLLLLPFFLCFLTVSGILPASGKVWAAPLCEVSGIDETPHLTVRFTVQETETGLSRISVTESTNAKVTIPSFTPDTSYPVIVTAVRINKNEYFSVALRAMSTTGELSTCGYSRESDEDDTPPECSLGAEDPGPPLVLSIIVQDHGSGLQTVSVTEAANATVSVPDFIPGTTDALTITAAASDAGGDFAVTLAFEDMAGNEGACRYTRPEEDDTPPQFSIIAENPGPPNTVTVSVEDTRQRSAGHPCHRSGQCSGIHSRVSPGHCQPPGRADHHPER